MSRAGKGSAPPREGEIVAGGSPRAGTGPTSVLLGVTGSIAAYKALEIVRGLRRAGHEVQVVMTPSARRFVAPLSFEALSGRPVMTELWAGDDGAIAHVEQGYDHDVAVVAPASAHSLARLAHGLADEILSATLLSSAAPLVLAPAMETRMWRHPATRANVASLIARGARLVGPGSGALASGRSGEGRMAEPEEVLAAVQAALGPHDLAGRRVVITAGPTHERLDPVRVLANRSTGAMGIELARAAARRGARVTLLLGPTHLEPPPEVETVRIESALDLLAAGEAVIDDADVLIAAAAVSDFRPAEPWDHKLKRSASEARRLELVENPDVLATLAARRRQAPGGDAAVIVGFAAETEDVERHARGKLARKGCDLVIGNLVGPDRGFGPGETSVLAVRAEGPAAVFGPAPKAAVADFVLDQVLAQHGERRR